LYVFDTIDAIFTILLTGERNCVYNIAGSSERKNIDIVKMVCRALKLKPTEFEKYVDSSYVRQGQDVRYAIDDSRLRNLGWKTKKNLQQEIPIIVQYYKDNFVW